MGFITFNRLEKKNSFTAAMLAQLAETVSIWERDSEVRVIILRGTGDVFCVGADVGELAAGRFDPVTHVREYRIYAECTKPTVASVNGLALGGGAELALMSDITIASERAQFGFTGPRVGATCSFANVRLAETVGRTVAKELLLTCSVVDAARALAIGLINEAVPHDELEGVTRRMAERLSVIAPLPIKHIKRGVDRSAESWTMMIDALTEIISSEDLKEGSRALFERRLPQFRGC